MPSGHLWFCKISHIIKIWLWQILVKEHAQKEVLSFFKKKTLIKKNVAQPQNVKQKLRLGKDIFNKCDVQKLYAKLCNYFVKLALHCILEITHKMWTSVKDLASKKATTWWLRKPQRNNELLRKVMCSSYHME